MTEPTPRHELHIVDCFEDLCAFAAQHFVTTVQAAIDAHGIAAVALSGGSTPKTLYALLATEPYRSQVDWTRVHVFWGDERAVAPDHPDSNYRMASQALLEPVGVPGSHIHRMPADAADTDAAARAYEAEICRVLGPAHPPRFHLVHLGMGDDGHTASLFPHTTALVERTRLVVPNPVEKLSTTRMTFTYPLLDAAEQVVFLVSGANKATVLQQVLEGPADHGTLPSQAVAPAGRLLWLVTSDAAAALTGQVG